MIKHDYTERHDKTLSPAVSATAVLKGTVTGYVFLIITFALLALVYTYTSFPAGLIGPFVSGITALSIAVCGMFSIGKVNGFGWLHGAAAGLLYSLLRIVISSVVTHSFSFGTKTLAAILLGITIGAVGGIVGINLKK